MALFSRFFYPEFVLYSILVEIGAKIFGAKPSVKDLNGHSFAKRTLTQLVFTWELDYDLFNFYFIDVIFLYTVRTPL